MTNTHLIDKFRPSHSGKRGVESSAGLLCVVMETDVEWWHMGVVSRDLHAITDKTRETRQTDASVVSVPS